jgi:DNA-binding transcriptional LysR family regulator
MAGSPFSVTPSTTEEATLVDVSRMMTLAQLRTFQTVARLNSFSRAAEELHLTQPAVSAQVDALETTLKVKLFDRIGKKITLAEAGYAALKAADEILNRVAELQRELADLSGLKGGALCIGASEVVGGYLLPELLGRFSREYPNIELTMRVEPARRIIDMLLANVLDVAIVGEGTAITDERIAVKPILLDELIVVVPSNHILSQRKSIPAAHLTDMPVIFPRKDSASSTSVVEQLAAKGVKLNSVMELGNVGAVKRAVEAGLGISIVSRHAVVHELADGRLKSVQISGMKLTRQIDLCWHHGKRFSKPTEAFIKFITNDGDFARPAGAALVS